MVKRIGEEGVLPFCGLENLSNIDKLQLSNYSYDLKTPSHIDYYSYTRFDKNNISFQKEYNF